MSDTPPGEETPQEAASGPKTGSNSPTGAEGGWRGPGGPEARAADRRQDLIESLRQLLGAKLLAYLLGLTSTAALRQPCPDGRLADDLHRLELAREVTDLLDEDAVASACPQGQNPVLGDMSPARILRDQGAASRNELLAAVSEHHR